ncbi:hypothetical protein PG993_003657 [Apiospora rasikravindrae]|uniref:Uncharacterized protein n=1 Tax=Apiospora rasikravindrae TaxID=990691 RepID=A0ABR1U072_9PEZI
MQFVGPSTPPHLVGQACHEARETMKSVFGGRPFRGPRGPKLIVGDELAVNNNYHYYQGDDEEENWDWEAECQGRYYWINPATTVFVLQGAETRDTTRLLDGFAPCEIARIQHLAVSRAHWAAIRALNLRLRQDCPGLRTLIIDVPRTVVHDKMRGMLQRAREYHPEKMHHDLGALDEADAARYASLSRPDSAVAADDARSALDRERIFVWGPGGEKQKPGEEGPGTMPVVAVKAPRVHLLQDPREMYKARGYGRKMKDVIASVG